MKNKMFLMEEIFDIYKGKRLTKADMTEGDVNYIGAISDDNGIREKIGQTALFKPNCITVNYNGSVGEAFYQIKPFWASDDVNVLYLKNKVLTQNIAMYLITLIKANKTKFSYGRKWTLEKMKSTEIPLPINDDDEIDWDYIENFMGNYKTKKITTTIQPVPMNDCTTAEFYLNELFEIKKSSNINYIDVTLGDDLNYVSRTAYNNGVQCKILNSGYVVNKPNCIIIGGESASVFYQDKPFITGNNITLLYNENLNKYNGLYMTCIISQNKFKYSYGRAFNKKNIENTIVKIPVKSDGSPNWKYMEEYIKSLPFSDRI